MSGEALAGRLAGQSVVTLLYAAHDVKDNQAMVLQEVLENQPGGRA